MTQNEDTADRPLVQPPVDDLDRYPYGDHATVLEEKVDEDADETPTVVCCPNCTEVLATFETGIPSVIAQFEERCSTCDVKLRRWSAVAVEAAYHDLVDAPQLTELTQAYWHDRIQAGVTNARGKVRNSEYADLFAATAKAFDWDWERACPLCRQSQTRYDYHHWIEQPDQGVVLCRECHDIIGFELPDYKVEQRVREWGLSCRNDLQVCRLALREAVVTGRDVHPGMATRLVTRYNLVQTPEEVESLLEALCTDPELYEQLVDDNLWSSFQDRR